MKSTIQWRFPSNDGGEEDGFNNGAIDHFKGHRLSSVVREVIQNSLDAEKQDHAKPVRVDFDIIRVKRGECPQVSQLKPHIEACLARAREQGLESAEEFYLNALNRIKNDSEVKFLVIQDSNTKGLVGPTDKSYGSWHALVKGSGISQKKVGSLGSFGHGSKAPFSLSDIRSVFYVSYVDQGKAIEKRFQGKSILQSHTSPISDNETQGTGYYGWTANCSPLITEDDIPSWAKSMREQAGGHTGTSICIPHYQLSEDEEPETAIAVIANFFYAIQNGALEVKVGKECFLTKENIQEQFFEYRQRLESEQDYIDIDRITENFESMLAVAQPMHSGRQEVPGLGSFKWYLRVDDPEQNKTRVAVARSNGMLIRHNPRKLERFPLRKPFEMFVCVDSEEGSDLLKRVENPRHDDFEFDRIENSDKRAEALKAYERLTKKVKEVIDRFAKIESDDRVIDTTLMDLLSQATETDKHGDSMERSDQIELSLGQHVFRPRPARATKPGSGPNATVEGQGHRGGDGTKKTDGGPIPGPGSGVVSGPSASDTKAVKYQSLSNLRVLPANDGSPTVRLIFDNPGEGDHSLVILRSGEESTDRVVVKTPGGGQSDEFSVVFGDEPRQQIDVTCLTSVKGYALQAKLVVREGS
jgi:hypothetical protein